MMKLPTISFYTRTFDLWFLRLGSALVFLISPFVPAQAAPRLDPEARAVLAAKPPAGTGVLVQQRGIASWYGRHWQGRRTASGVRFDDRALTAASLSLPFATRARITNLHNGQSVDVVVNDRGPYHAGRIIDLSARAAQAIGMKESGIAPVLVQAVLVPRPQVLARIAMR